LTEIQEFDELLFDDQELEKEVRESFGTRISTNEDNSSSCGFS
jgi:hypothetical protein